MNLEDMILKQGISVEQIDINKMLNNFRSEMVKGMKAIPSSLAMLDSYLDIPNNCSEETVAIIDAGGTNLRIGLGSLNENGKVELSNFIKKEMPGKVSQVSSDQFYQILTDYLYPFRNDFKKIGFCFSYPTKILPNHDGELLYWTKEINIPDLVNCPVGKGLLNALNKRGIKNKQVAILNDTVATLLSGYTQGVELDCNQYIGFILGTGTNTSCVINNRIINIESGGFAKFPLTQIDNNLDINSSNPGSYRFEKAIAGEYLGNLTLLLSKELARNKIFSDKGSKFLISMKEAKTAYFSELINNNKNNKNPFYSDVFNDYDRSILSKISNKIIDRASLFAAINIAAAILEGDRNNGNQVCVTVDGSTFYKNPRMAIKIEQFLKQILDIYKISFIFIKIEDAPAVGATIAATNAF